MSKTVTIRLDDEAYRLIRQAARGQLRSIANFIEYATLIVSRRRGLRFR